MADEGEVLSSYKAIASEVKQLLEDGLEDKTLANLKDRLAAVQPQHLVRRLFSVRPITMLTLHVTEKHILLGFLDARNNIFLGNILMKCLRLPIVQLHLRA